MKPELKPAPLGTSLAGCPIETIKVLRMCRERKIVCLGGVPHIYSEPLCYWVSLYTNLGLGTLVDILGVNAPVNFAIACSRYLELIRMRATDVTIPRQSVCIAGRRRYIKVKRRSVEYLTGKQDDAPITRERAPGGISPTVKIPLHAMQLPRLPLKSAFVPVKCKFDQPDDISDFLLQIFNEHQLDLLKWVIGHGLVDPVPFPMCLLLHGRRGGEGKSRVIDVLQGLLAGSISPMSSDYLSGSSKVSSADLDLFMSYRFLYISDSEIKGGYVNSHFLKQYFGNDMVSSASGAVALRSVLIAASNNIWFPHKGQLKAWRVRRFTTIVMKDAYSGPKEQLEVKDNEHRFRFITKCIATRMSTERPPYTFEDFAYNLFGSCVESATRGIQVDEYADPLDCLAATICLSYCAPMLHDDLISCALSMSEELVIECLDLPCLKGIRLRE